MAGHRQAGPALSGRAWGAAVVIAGLLLFTWPFVRSPPLGLAATYFHLLGAWLAVVAATWLTSRALGRDGPDA